MYLQVEKGELQELDRFLDIVLSSQGRSEMIETHFRGLDPAKLARLHQAVLQRLESARWEKPK
jgi:hypothetical protein